MRLLLGGVLFGNVVVHSLDGVDIGVVHRLDIVSLCPAPAVTVHSFLLFVLDIAVLGKFNVFLVLLLVNFFLLADGLSPPVNVVLVLFNVLLVFFLPS